MHRRDISRVYILDTTNRDGDQATIGAKYGVNSKLVISRTLASANIDRIEVGFPASSPADFEAMQTVAREVQGPLIFGLSRSPVVGKSTNYEEILRTYEAVKDAPYRGIHLFSIMFDPYSLKKYGLTREQVVDGAVLGVEFTRKVLKYNGQIEFSFQNATNTPIESIVEAYKRVIEAGADVINVPDTIGYSYPDEIKGIISTLRNEVPPDVMISIHCHDDLGLAVANSLEAVKAGADIVECTVNGIGERAGNAALEEVVMNILVRKDIYGRTVNMKTEMLNPLSRLVEEHYGISVQENKAIVGRNAFRHRSGIHQDGMIKGGLYEIINPKKVGWNGERYGLTAKSGIAGLSFRLKFLGFDILPNILREAVMPEFKKIADEKGEINDADLIELVKRLNL